jgi:hypothetical protein
MDTLKEAGLTTEQISKSLNWININLNELQKPWFEVTLERYQSFDWCIWIRAVLQRKLILENTQWCACDVGEEETTAHVLEY